MNDQQRTLKQNASLHKWARQCSELMIERGIPLSAILEKMETRHIELEWDKNGDMFKALFRSILHKVYPDIESTAGADTKQYNVIYEGLCKWYAQEEGIELPPWPDKFSQAQEFAEELYK